MGEAMIERLFLSHPRDVGETWGEHFLTAMGFAGALARAAAACAVHAFVPGLCRTTGSRAITQLHGRMVANRRKPAPQEDAAMLWIAANI